MADSPKLKDRLEKLRLSKKLRQKEMAALLGLPLSTYRSYEHGKRHPNKWFVPELDRRINVVVNGKG